ncbi:PAS domain S-box protein [Geobacter pelophilus]|uniref:PAS domain S-box protein n=2 Tax=Geoanaerobacter pelophilus TaxID=60036 RepID=A0AAW4L7C7_9BACT|nr:PAS domain S-box protein [Geoanaerobacter pelophilus]
MIKAPARTPFSDLSGIDQSLINSELRYRRLFETAQDGILILNAETGLISDVNPYLIEMLGYSREEFVEKKLWEVGAFKDVEASRNSFLALQKNKYIRYENLPLKTKGGRLVPVEFVSNVYLVGEEKVIQCNIRDISDRKRAEAALRAKDEANWSLIENLEDHWLLIKHLPIGVVVHAPDTRIVMCNPEASQLLGKSPDQMLGKGAGDPYWHFVHEDGTRLTEEELPVNQVVASGHLLKNFVMGIIRGTDEESWVLVNAYPEFGSDEQLRQVVVTLADISNIKCAEERIQRHLEHLTALVEIDRAINFSFDLNLSMTTLLTHVIVQLEVDAADVLLFNPQSRTLEFVAGRGFNTKTIEHVRQPLGEGYAGGAAQERSMVHVPDLTKEHDSFLGEILLAGEEFVSYFGVPLIAKGQLMGVLEVFHRSPQSHDENWLDFLKALAAQAAIAIDNVTLFDNLQRSNIELAQAYNATIEGWSRALELRDNETEGHTQRVAVLTVKLARLFGLSDEELVQVRWGALLHDIGKMAIPDAILLKHDSLTEAEWVVMRNHTAFAFEMLSPIRYLRSALDIPYSHHEKWDGTGYPLGLKGDQIPLAARIFAVVDVWDALRSDRRYRSSWSVEKVREHLRSLSGTHFDPHVVKVCLDSDVLIY